MANPIAIDLRTKVHKLGSGSPIVVTYAQLVLLLYDKTGQATVPVVVRLDTGSDLTLLPEERLRAAGQASKHGHLKLSTLTGAFTTTILHAGFALEQLPSLRIDAVLGCLPAESPWRYARRLLKQAFGENAVRPGLLALHDLTKTFDVSFVGQQGRGRLVLHRRP